MDDNSQRTMKGGTLGEGLPADERALPGWVINTLALTAPAPSLHARVPRRYRPRLPGHSNSARQQN